MHPPSPPNLAVQRPSPGRACSLRRVIALVTLVVLVMSALAPRARAAVLETAPQPEATDAITGEFPAPVGLVAIDAGDSSVVRLGWRDSSANIAGFFIESQSAVRGDAWGEPRTLGAPSQARIASDRPGPGRHRYRISSFRESGERSPFSAWAEVEVARGWTPLVPAPDSLRIFVSTTGSDSNDGLTPSNPIRTLEAARGRVRAGSPDWVLLRCGDLFHENDVEVWHGGRSAREPAVWTSYGEGPRPVIVPKGTWPGIAIQEGASNLAIVGLHFRGVADSPASGIQLFVGRRPFGNLLIEDCVVERFKDNINIQGRIAGPNFIRGVAIRRSIVADAYPRGRAHSQGAYIDSVEGLLIEECVFDRNGWADKQRSDATIFSHNLYLGTRNGPNATIRRCIIARASSHGVQLRGGGVIEDNLFLLNPIAAQLGGGDPVPATHAEGVTGQVRGNVVLNGVDINGSLPRGMGILAFNIGRRGATIENNIVAFNQASDVNAVPIHLWADSYGAGVGVNNVRVAGNVIYDWRGPLVIAAPAAPRAPSPDCTVDGVVIESNDIQMPVANDTTANCVSIRFASTPGQVRVASNRYWSVRPSDQWLRYDGVAMSIEQWTTASGDQGSRAEKVVYVDPKRDASTHAASAGLGATALDLLAAARLQRRGDWRPERAAAAALAHVKEGFTRER